MFSTNNSSLLFSSGTVSNGLVSPKYFGGTSNNLSPAAMRYVANHKITGEGSSYQDAGVIRDEASIYAAIKDDPTYSGPVRGGQKISIPVSSGHKEGLKIPAFTISGTAASDLEMAIAIQDHNSGQNYEFRYTRNHRHSDWKVNIGYLEERYGSKSISSQESLAAIAVTHWVALYTSLSIIAKIKKDLDPSLVKRVESLPPDAFSKAKSMADVASILGIDVMGESPKGPVVSTEGPIVAKSDGRPAGLPYYPIKKGKKASGLSSHDDPNTPGGEPDCLICHDMNCTLGRSLGDYEFDFCGGIKVDLLHCCVKHDVALFCGERWDAPMPLTLLTTPAEIEAWAIDLNLKFGSCIMGELLDAWFRNANFFCILFLSGAAILAAVAIGLGLALMLWGFTHVQIIGWLLGERENRIGIGGEHDHCCICGGGAHTPTFCCTPSDNPELCNDIFGERKDICGLDDCAPCRRICHYDGHPGNGDNRKRRGLIQYSKEPNTPCLGCSECTTQTCPDVTYFSPAEVEQLRAEGRYHEIQGGFAWYSDWCPVG